MTVHTIIFDAGLTLLTVAPSWWDVFARGCGRAGVDLPPFGDHAEAAMHVFAEHDDAWRAAGNTSPHVGDDEAEAAFWRELYRRFLVAMEVEGDHEHATAIIYDAFQEPGVFVPFPEVDEVLDDLERRGLTLAIVSNWGPWLREVLAAAELDDRFATVVVSGEERMEKPDAAIFHLALERLGIAPSPDVVYVGDDIRADVEGSAAVGLTPVLIDRRNRHGDHAGLRIEDLRQLSQVLDLPPATA